MHAYQQNAMSSFYTSRMQCLCFDQFHPVKSWSHHPTSKPRLISKDLLTYGLDNRTTMRRGLFFWWICSQIISKIVFSSDTSKPINLSIATRTPSRVLSFLITRLLVYARNTGNSFIPLWNVKLLILLMYLQFDIN